MNVSAVEILARTSEGQKSGPLGFAVILVLAVASYFLFKSMSKHLKKVREEFPTDDVTPEARPPVDGPIQTDDAIAPSVAEDSSPPTA